MRKLLVAIGVLTSFFAAAVSPALAQQAPGAGGCGDGSCAVGNEQAGHTDAFRTIESGLIGSDARSAGREETSFSDGTSTSFSGTRDLTTGESAGHTVTPTGTCSGQNC